MSTKTSSTAIYAIILTMGVLFIPLQFSFANTYHLQGIVGHICDQTMSTIHASGCSSGASYRAVQNTVPPDTNSSSGDSSSAYPATSDRRHDAQ
jgi:hypothetical protein